MYTDQKLRLHSTNALIVLFFVRLCRDFVQIFVFRENMRDLITYMHPGRARGLWGCVRPAPARAESMLKSPGGRAICARISCTSHNCYYATCWSAITYTRNACNARSRAHVSVRVHAHDAFGRETCAISAHGHGTRWCALRGSGLRMSGGCPCACPCPGVRRVCVCACARRRRRVLSL